MNTTGSVQQWPFTLYWFLNSVGIRNGTSNSIELLASTTGQDFDYALIDAMFWYGYLPSHYHCNSTAGALIPSSLPNEDISLCATPPTSNGTPYRAPRFGRDSMSMYIAVMGLAAIVWTSHPFLARSKDPVQARNVVMSIHVSATVLFLASSAVLTAGVNNVVADSPIVLVFRNQASLAIIWCATVCQILHCIAQGFSFWLWRKNSMDGAVAAASGGGNRGSLPGYRAREGEPEELDDLPPYQREDPLGQPPSIDTPHAGSRDSGSRGADSGIGGVEEAERRRPTPEHNGAPLASGEH